MLEKELRANWDSVFYPEPEPEVETFGEEVEPVGEPVLLAAGPSGTMTDGGAAVGVFPQMKPRRAGASEVGANLPLLAADVAAGGGKGLISGGVGLAGDVLAIGRGLYEIGRRGGDQSAVDAFMSGMEKGFILPTSDDVDKWLTQNIGPVVPPGGPIQGAREAAAGAGRLAGELVADPFVAVKGAKAAVKGAKVAGKALAPKAGEMLDAYMQRTGMQQNLMAYHGSPYNIEKFDPKKIGTGEGAQAYGYGLYFAESKDVAQGYRVRLAYEPEKMRVGGKQINAVYKTIENAAAKMPPEKAQLEYEKLDILERLMMNEMPGDLQDVADAMSPATKEWFDKTVKPSFETYGNLYTVEIPDEMVSKMLDWDKPLSQQPDIVKSINPQSLGLTYKQLENGNHAFVNSEGKILGNLQKGGTQESFAKNWTEDVLRGTGGDLYRQLGQGMEGGPKVSSALRQAGIPGVRYLDQGSRGDGKGTRNLVVFPGGEDQVKIIKSEGQGK